MAAEKPASGTSSEDVEQALAYLELLWGDAFTIGHDEQGISAKPNEQDGETLRADDPDGRAAAVPALRRRAAAG